VGTEGPGDIIQQREVRNLRDGLQVLKGGGGEGLEFPLGEGKKNR